MLVFVMHLNLKRLNNIHCVCQDNRDFEIGKSKQSQTVFCPGNWAKHYNYLSDSG